MALRMFQPARILLGGHGRFVAAVTTPVQRLVFVCAGNICRSPFGECLARRGGVPAISMGLHATTGSVANPVAVRHAQSHGIDLQPHRATLFSADSLRESDLVIGFELWHLQALEHAVAGRRIQLRLLGGFLGLGSYHIHDPYGLHEEYFASCFSTIKRATDALTSKVKLRLDTETQ